jgi:FAD/FMN-containing dehydrogenase
MTTTRRNFLRLGGVGVLAWTPVHKLLAGDPAAPCLPPSSFPTAIPIYLQAFKNWSGEIVLDAVWTAAPESPDEVVQIVNWAAREGYQIRARGNGHNWSPILVAPGTGCDSRVVLLDTRIHLNAVSIDTAATPPTVTAQCGILMENLLLELEKVGLGVTATPGAGDITLGGALAINGHGTAVPAVGEQPVAGHTYGSLSNLVVSLTIVAWNSKTSQYELRRIHRSDPEASSLSPHLGRTFVVEAVLRVGVNQRLRCQSITDIPADELFGPSTPGARTLASFVDQSGRVEAIAFPFSDKPWLKVWSLSPVKPEGSREVTTPYNYPFSDSITPGMEGLLDSILSGAGFLTPQLGPLQMAVVEQGLALTQSSDIWGWSRNLLLYIRPTTLRITANGYAVQCRRSDVQRTVQEFYRKLVTLRDEYRNRGLYPTSSAIEIRVTGLERPEDCAVPGATSPRLSSLRATPSHPEWDTAVWFDLLVVPGTPHAFEFYRDLERWFYENYSGDYASVRVEWSKGWAYTDKAAWAAPEVVSGRIPESLTVGQASADGFRAAMEQLDGLDPFRVFSTPFLDQLMPPTQTVRLVEGPRKGSVSVQPEGPRGKRRAGRPKISPPRVNATLRPANPGRNVVETSPDLRNWAPVSTNPPGPVEITVEATGEQRFFRIVPVK